jgi:hypothetical protein
MSEELIYLIANFYLLIYLLKTNYDVQGCYIFLDCLLS